MGERRGAAATSRLLEATSRMITGHAEDLALGSCPAASLDRCLAMAADKTAALIACATTVGAILADGPPATVAALDRYGHHLGLAFQAVDDLLGIWGDPSVTGKPVFSDLRERKKTVPVVAALAAGGPAAQRLAELFAGEPPDEDVLGLAAGLIDEAGGRTATEDLARQHLAAALAALERAPLAARAAADLEAIALYVCQRDR